MLVTRYDSSSDMEEPRPATRALMPRFTYDELPEFIRTVKLDLAKHRRAWKYERGKMPVEDALELLDASPQPDSAFDTWHLSVRDTLLEQATQWHQQRQAGAAQPVPLDGESLIEYYFSLLETRFEPHKKRGKLRPARGVSAAVSVQGTTALQVHHFGAVQSGDRGALCGPAR